MKSKGIGLVVLAGFLIFCSGCTTLKGNVPFQYQPSLISITKQINKSIGFNIVTDQRPANEIRAMEKTIQDVPNKVTYKMMEDFKSSGIFTEVNFPQKSSDDIVVNGNIEKFSWKVNTNWFAIITYMMYFGLPVEEHVGEVAISLNVVDNKTGQTLATIKGEGLQKSSYSLYNMSVGEAGSELAEAFRQCVKELKEKMLSNVNFGN